MTPRTLLLALLLAVYANALSLTSVSFPVIKREYIQICVGNPCEMLNFRINRTLNGIWLHKLSYLPSSTTVFQSQNGAYFDEFFYFDGENEELMMRLQFTPCPPVMEYVAKDAPTIDGTFGLGTKAEIFQYWGNYSLSSKRLVLGAYDRWGQSDPYEEPPVMILDETHTVTLGDQTESEIVFDFSSIQSYVPYGINLSVAFDTLTIQSRDCQNRYRQLGISSGRHCKDNVTIIPDQFQTIILPNNVRFSAIEYTEHDKVIAGARLMSDVFWFRDVYNNAVIITQDAYYMDHITFSVTASVVLSLALIFWLSIVDVRRELVHPFEYAFLLVTECLFYIVGLMVLWALFGMLDWRRYITHMARHSSWYAIVYVVTAYSASCLYFLYTFVGYTNKAAYLKRLEREALFRSMLIVTAAIALIWLCLIHQHDNIMDLFMLAFWVSASIAYQCTAAFLFLIQSEWLYFGVAFTLIALATAFNIVFNLIPMFRMETLGFPLDAACFLWVLCLQVLPGAFAATIVKLRQGADKLKAD